MLLFKTPSEITLAIAERAKQIRLSLNLTQKGLAQRSNVCLNFDVLLAHCHSLVSGQ